MEVFYYSVFTVTFYQTNAFLLKKKKIIAFFRK